MTRPNYVNVTKYLLHTAGYDSHIDLASAIEKGKIGNPKHYYADNFVRIEINGEDIDFKTTPESTAFLQEYINIVL